MKATAGSLGLASPDLPPPSTFYGSKADEEEGEPNVEGVDAEGSVPSMDEQAPTNVLAGSGHVVNLDDELPPPEAAAAAREPGEPKAHDDVIGVNP